MAAAVDNGAEAEAEAHGEVTEGDAGAAVGAVEEEAVDDELERRVVLVVVLVPSVVFV